MTATAVATDRGFRVQVPAALAAKAEYLKVLVAKMKNAAVKAVQNAIAFVRTYWSYVPAKTAGTAAAVMTMTRTGYTALTSLVRASLKFLANNYKRIETAVHNGIDKLGIFISSIAGRVNKTFGEKLATFNSKFTDVRWNVITKVRAAVGTTGNLFHEAYTSDTTVTVTTATATAISVAIFADTLFKGALVSSALTVPVIGGTLASIAAGGTTAIIALAAAATLGAAITAFNTFGKAQLVSMLKPAFRFVRGESVVSYETADGAVIVENAADADEATRIAVEHVTETNTALEQMVLRHGKRR